MDLENLKKKIQNFNNERNWDQFHSVKNLVMALSVESSELLELFQWMKEEDSNHLMNHPEIHEKAKNEVADIFLYLMQVSMKLNMDLESTVLSKMQLNAEKYPVEKAKGQSTKYDQL